MERPARIYFQIIQVLLKNFQAAKVEEAKPKAEHKVSLNQARIDLDSGPINTPKQQKVQALHLEVRPQY
jgi:hypothetical protein